MENLLFPPSISAVYAFGMVQGRGGGGARRRRSGRRRPRRASCHAAHQPTGPADREHPSSPGCILGELAILALAYSDILAGATDLLLEANVSTAYQPDNKGLYPIHVAASSNDLDTVKALLKRCPECATLRDVKGRTFLHVAAAKDTVDVVHHVCTTPELFFILNAQDKNGDTALHRAVHAGNIYVADILLAHPGVRADLSNDAAMTPADLSLTKIPKMSVFFQLLVSRN